MSLTKVTLKYGETKYNLELGLGFLGEFLDATDMDLEEVGNKLTRNPFKLVPVLVFHAMKWKVEFDEGGVFEMTQKDVIKMIEKDGGLIAENTKRFLRTFTRSLTKDVPIEPVVDGAKSDVKKK